jgi:hypothetical protein
LYKQRKIMKIKYLLLYSLLILITSCKEEPQKKEPCQNGFLDPGEVSIDCGGPCQACEPVYIPYLNHSLNQSSLSYSNGTIEYINNYYYLSFGSDSLTVSINLGSSGTIGTYPLETNEATLFYKGISYPYITNGFYSISSFDSDNKLISGFFSFDANRNIAGDTLRITNGQFENISYE